MAKKTKYKKKAATLKLSKIVHLLGKILGLVIKEQEVLFFSIKLKKLEPYQRQAEVKKIRKK